MINESILVTSRSFSNNLELRSNIESKFEKVDYLTNDIFDHDLKNYVGAIIGLTKIDHEFLDTAENLKAISKFGVGLDNIDLIACEKREIFIGHKNGVNSRSVAEHTLGLIIGISRNLFLKNFEMHNGIWNKAAGRSLSELKIGIIGLGHIGKELVKLLQPHQCKISVHDIKYDEAFIERYGLEVKTKEEILVHCDLVSLHLPLDKLTNNYLGISEFKKMKSSAWVINTSRGAIINQQALSLALKERIIYGAALDVFEQEPLGDSFLIRSPYTILTPHCAGTSREAILKLGMNAIERLQAFFDS